MAFTNARFVFTKSHIQDPMHAIFDPPTTAHGRCDCPEGPLLILDLSVQNKYTVCQRGKCIMARPKMFDRTERLDKAMELFWSRGYEATSIHDLLVHLVINRQSLYDTFGDKHTLFLETLKRYEELGKPPLLAELEGP